jgi:hypothetical protein
MVKLVNTVVSGLVNIETQSKISYKQKSSRGIDNQIVYRNTSLK